MPTGLAGSPGRIPIFTAGPEPSTRSTFCRPKSGNSPPTTTSSSDSISAAKQGWPFYNIPNPTNDPNAPLKIPSGANIFAQSPLKDVRSSYGNGVVAERQIHALERRHRTDQGHHRVGGGHSGSNGEAPSSTSTARRRGGQKDRLSCEGLPRQRRPAGRQPSPGRYPIPSRMAPPSRPWIKRRGRSP